MAADSLFSLRRTLRDALTAVLSATPVLLLGCGPGPGIEDDPDFVAVECVGGVPEYAAGLSPEPPAENVQVQRSFDGEGFPFGFGQDTSPTATLTATRSGEALSVTSEAQLREFLGAIDTRAEAIFLAEVSRFNVDCVRGGTRPAGDGFDVQAHRGVGCDGRDRYLLHVTRAGEVSEISRTEEKRANPNCTVGRRPSGYCPSERQQDSSTVGGYLAHAAELEAASVPAFERLEAELSAHGAPVLLRLRARCAARDERRHARLVAGLARAFGGAPRKPEILAQPARGLPEIALENAVEGCVRETFGALVAEWQALHATDRRVRRLYRGIAADELRHAALSWRVARWLEPRLDQRARRRVAVASQAAVHDLREALGSEPSREVVALAGVPTAGTARALLREVETRLWLAPEHAA